MELSKKSSEMGSPMVGLDRMDAKFTWVPMEPRGRRRKRSGSLQFFTVLCLPSDRKKTTVTQAGTRLCESMGPDTMAQRTDIGKENEQDGKGLEQLYLGERIIFTRRGWSQAMCIGSRLEGPWQARQDAVG